MGNFFRFHSLHIKSLFVQSIKGRTESLFVCVCKKKSRRWVEQNLKSDRQTNFCVNFKAQCSECPCTLTSSVLVSMNLYTLISASVVVVLAIFFSLPLLNPTCKFFVSTVIAILNTLFMLKIALLFLFWQIG